MSSPPLSLSNFAPILLLYFLLHSPSPAAGLDVAALLSHFPNLSSFAALLSNSSVATDLLNRSSLTILAVPNSLLRPSDVSAGCSADVLRSQILLEYLSPAEFSQIPPSGKLVNTLLEGIGRAPAGLGSVNVTHSAASSAVSIRSAAANATVVGNVTAVPYNVSVLEVDALLVPCGLDLTASESRPPPGVNITLALSGGHTFNVAAAMLEASGVVAEFENDEAGAGITIFAPVDDAFSGAAANLQPLEADRKAVVLRFHVLHSYYPLGSLESIVNPVQPTLATEAMGAGSYTLNISRINGSVTISTGIVQAGVTQTVFDQKPVAIFGVSKVLLPRELFGKDSTAMQPPGGEAAPPTGVSLTPESPPGLYSPPSRLSAPPGVREGIGSGANIDGPKRESCFLLLTLAVCCIGLYPLV